MATKLSKLAGALLLFAPLVVGQGAGGKQICDKQGITMCYWSVADEHGTIPLTNSAQGKDTYLASLCNGNPYGFPEDNRCKQESYASCTDAEKKKFARQERGYAVLRGETTAAESCQSVVQLRECMDLSIMSSCDVNPEFPGATFDAHVEAKDRAAHNLKACVEKAVKPCDAKKNAAAIAHLQKIADAIVDLNWPYDKPNAAHTTKAATALVAVSLLSWIVRYLY